MNKKIMLLIIMSLFIAILFSGSVLSTTGLMTEPDAAHSIPTDEHGCWLNPVENNWGHYDEEHGNWIKFRD